MLAKYNFYNNLLGWLCFAVAAYTYVATVEPTASFWDCGEYISTAVKLQVGHPPGAPFFQLTGNVLAQLAWSNPEMQAFWVNMVSVLSSAFTILFLFWTITALGKKMAVADGSEWSPSKMIAVFASGLVGALCYTFSDSFWFSAGEGEVYAMSSFFTAVAFWAMLKWENEVDKSPRANRWLVFIAYMVGLSVGVHILVFLTIPAISMIYYFKKTEKVTPRGFILANLIAIVVLGVVFKGIIPFTLNAFGKLEIFFVNSLGMPFNSGSIFAVLLFVAVLYFGLDYSRKRQKPLWNTAILSVIFIMIGYTSFITLAIRSNANTPIDENNPEDALSLLAYYNREQYGDWPVIYGQSFNAELDQQQPFKDGTPVYEANDETGRYEITDDRKGTVRNFDKDYVGFFPRMWSDDPEHVRNYIQLADLKNPKAKPTFAQHFGFFMDYQVGQMWWRYFMWNFAGRQNDEQNRYELTKGNWISGLDFIDEGRLGPQDNLPSRMANNPARNVYYMLPFLLGLVGLFFHYQRDWKDAWVVTLFFLFTGLAIVVYTNHKPFEPRERDYAFVGSFYVYAIWVGLGVLAVFQFLNKKFQNVSTAAALGVVLLVAVPGVMASENWDDHNRSNRYTARDIAKAYLDSCEPNAILFTNGDNDTFPLWYVQEIEGYRTDVRIVNLSLLNTDWYIDQMRRATYDAAPVPFDWEHHQYVQGTRDVLYYQDRGQNGRWRAEDFLRWIKSDDPSTRFAISGGKELQFYPVKKLRLNIDKEKVLANKVVAPEDTARILNYIDWDLGGNVLYKRDLMVLDLIIQNDWTRPIYFSITVGNSAKSYFWLQDYFRLEGLAYRFVPVKAEGQGQGIDFGEVGTEYMYDNLMNKFTWGNMNHPDVYLDETNRRLSYNFRNIFGRLALELIKEGDKTRAREVLDRCEEVLPESKFEYNYFIFPIIDGYYQLGDKEKARGMIDLYADRLDEELRYYAQFTGSKRKAIEQDVNAALQYYQMCFQLVRQYELGNASSREQLESDPFFQRFKTANDLVGGRG